MKDRITVCFVACLLSSSMAFGGEEAPRFRFGAGGGFGVFTPGVSVTTTGAVRSGMQLSPGLGVYLETGLSFGFGVGISNDNGGTSSGVSGVYYSYFAPMVELDHQRVFVATGPLVARGAWGYRETSFVGGGSSSRRIGIGGDLMPGMQARVGLMGFGPEKKHGTTFGLDMKFMRGRVRNVVLNNVDVTDQPGTPRWSLGFAPSLVIAYDKF